MKTAAIVAWSGYGEFDDLKTSVSRKLEAGKEKAGVTGDRLFLTVAHHDPVWVARRLAHLPGVAWVAGGYQFDGEPQLTARLLTLAKHYLREGMSFSIDARVEDSDREEGDILLDGDGMVLKSISGTRVDEKKPDVMFRVVMVGKKGTVGASLRTGPGGVPLSARAKMTCLVSGGYHSAAAAWMASLSGYAVTLVHAREPDDESFRQVGRLYAELSARVDSTALQLRVLDGPGKSGDRLAKWLDATRDNVVAGAHPECRGMKQSAQLRAFPSVAFPLLLLQEEDIRIKLDSLGIKKKRDVDDAARLVITKRREPFTVRKFGGRESDINGVLDGLR
jgi:hypothetical protein